MSLVAAVMALTFWPFATFLVLAIVGFFITATLVEENLYGKSFGVIIVDYILLDWLIGWKMTTAIIADPMIILIYLAVYCAIGLIWSIIKFTIFMKKLRADSIKNKTHILGFDNYKSNIMCWMIYWPFSIIGTMVSDLISNIFEAIYNSCGKVFKRIYDHYTKDLK